MSWDDMDVWAFDVETNGTNVFEDRILTAALVRVSPDDSTLEREWVINPEVPIPEEATKVNGLTEEWIREHGTDPSQTLEKIGAAVRWVLDQSLPLALHNAAFDLSMLETELARYGHAPIGADRMTTILDPMVLGKFADQTLARPRRYKDPATGKGYVYRLPEMCARFGVTFQETHQSTADATGTARLARAMGKKEKDLAAIPPGELFRIQRTARREHQHSFRTWVVKEGKQEQYGEIDGGWPLHTSLIGATV